jgi:hypothetical protein
VATCRVLAGEIHPQRSSQMTLVASRAIPARKSYPTCHISRTISRAGADCSRSPFEIGNRQSKIRNCTVPVVQRIERRFPNPSGSPPHEASSIRSCCRNTPIAVSNRQLSGNKWRQFNTSPLEGSSNSFQSAALDSRSERQDTVTAGILGKIQTIVEFITELRD